MGENDVIGALAVWRHVIYLKKLELFCDLLHNERPDFDLAVLLRRWWILCSRQYVRRDTPVTINCVISPLHFHVVLTLLSL